MKTLLYIRLLDNETWIKVVAATDAKLRKFAKMVYATAWTINFGHFVNPPDESKMTLIELK